jgi:uncharacterized LabA/DUF88 family protein
MAVIVFIPHFFLVFSRSWSNTVPYIPLVPSGIGREAATAERPRGLCFFMALKANVYIDGFNLYYGCLRKSPYKWLDLNALCSRLLPTNQLNRIRYFTAAVTPRANDPRQGQRQQAYLRALGTLSNVSVIMGHFLTNKVWLMRTDYSGKVEVFKTEEKGSDVNLASYILTDAYESQYDVAVIVSNDSDLAYPINYVKKRMGKIIGIVNPHKKPSYELNSIATFYKTIRPAVLSACQFPQTLTDGNGTFHRPSDWDDPSVP